MRLTSQLKEASQKAAGYLGRPIVYLPSSHTDKAACALKIAQRDAITSGLIAVLTCLFLYHYLIDPVFGFMNARIQTWLFNNSHQLSAISGQLMAES